MWPFAELATRILDPLDIVSPPLSGAMATDTPVSGIPHSAKALAES
ncbi:hypothetical protein GCM10010112_64240 [Actinoplanes lobatus]|uniref:Uncharacterized protein n=1 Tax=Actinoplanes lobatus TaxID=113568 RepID=A0A7W7HN43_9ACTN|nr:hypothetical protein [Actinoplanes lobatus]GGN84696.1 hypothetical protein GCM10010112_64240 [Actinoplanes lobatus]GIE38120.1 hypothetical protein Alo02nite_10180 [Actinoplanes lobatus]